MTNGFELALWCHVMSPVNSGVSRSLLAMFGSAPCLRRKSTQEMCPRSVASSRAVWFFKLHLFTDLGWAEDRGQRSNSHQSMWYHMEETIQIIMYTTGNNYKTNLSNLIWPFTMSHSPKPDHQHTDQCSHNNNISRKQNRSQYGSLKLKKLTLTPGMRCVWTDAKNKCQLGFVDDES